MFNGRGLFCEETKKQSNLVTAKPEVTNSRICELPWLL